MSKSSGDFIYYVYGYFDINNTPFYIGMGHGNRMQSHIYNSKRFSRKTTFYNKLNKMILNSEYFYSKKIKEGLSIECAIELEMELISKYGRRDLNLGPLCNLTDGGEGHRNYKRSPETIEAVRIKNTGQKRSIEFVENIRARMTGIKLSQETKNKISAIQKGTKKPKPIESLPNYKAAAKIKSESKEFAEKVSNSKRLLFSTPVVQVDKISKSVIMVWSNQYDAANKVDSVGYKIVMACKSGASHKNFIWEFYDK